MASLFSLVEKSDLRSIRRKVGSGSPVDQRRSDGVTPLILAVAQGRADVVELLLELGADTELATVENLTALDFARGSGNLAIEELLRHAVRSRAQHGKGAAVSPIASGLASDMTDFLDDANLVLPPRCLEAFRRTMTDAVGKDRADQIMTELENTNYRFLFEQLFAPEALAVAYITRNYETLRSPMCIGKYDVAAATRRGVDLAEAHSGKFKITDALLQELLPDSLFASPPKAVCEVGGAWGATIHHIVNRFKPLQYYNYEPDRHFAAWTQERYSAKAMPVDGETLQGTPDDSIDLAIANNVFIFVPPIKVWSYLMEMRRVLREGGVIIFNAAISDQITEGGLRHYLENYFPKRAIHILPRDFIDRALPSSEFELVAIHDKEYMILRRKPRTS